MSEYHLVRGRAVISTLLFWFLLLALILILPSTVYSHDKTKPANATIKVADGFARLNIKIIWMPGRPDGTSDRVKAYLFDRIMVEIRNAGYAVDTGSSCGRTESVGTLTLTVESSKGTSLQALRSKAELVGGLDAENYTLTCSIRITVPDGEKTKDAYIAKCKMWHKFVIGVKKPTASGHGFWPVDYFGEGQKTLAGAAYEMPELLLRKLPPPPRGGTEPSAVSAGEIGWTQSFDEAYEAAKKEKKPVMIDIYTDWCGGCKKLDTDVYTAASVVRLSQKFVCLKLNPEKDTQHAGVFKTEGFPTILFTDPDQKELGRISGYVPAGIFVQEMNNALQAFTSPAEARIIEAHDAIVWSVAFSPDSSTLASASEDTTAKLWDVQTGDLKRTLKGHTGLVRSVVFAPDGKTLVSGSFDNTVKIWDPLAGVLRRTLHDTHYVFFPVFSRDGKTLVTGSGDKQVRIWNLETGELAQKLTGPTADAWSVALSPDGKIVACGPRENTVFLWELSTGAGGAPSGRLLRTLKGHTNAVNFVAFSPDGKILASASGDRTVRLWDVDTGDEKHILTGHGATVFEVAFTPDGGTLASASGDRTVRLWDARTGELERTLRGGGFCVAFSPDGKTLASGGDDHMVRLWDLQRLRPLRQ